MCGFLILLTVPITPFLVVNYPGTCFLLWQNLPRGRNPHSRSFQFFSFTFKNGYPDAAWKSTLTSSVISINSVCDRSKKRNRESLKSVTQTLLSQWDRLRVVGESQHTLSGFPALSTIAEGMYSGESRKFKITIVKSPTCIYDLVLVSPTESFERDLSVFQSFHDNLNLK